MVSQTIVITAVDGDDKETNIGYVESHNVDLCESLYVIDPGDIPEGTVCIAIRLIP